MFGVGHERLARSRVVVAGAVTGILVLVPLPVHAGTPRYHAAVQYAAGSQPRSVVTVAVHGDGNLDIVAVDPFGVSVLLGAGDGSFGAAVRQPVGTFLSSVSIGDVNGDHDPDLVLGQFAGQVLVLLGGPGATFGAPAGLDGGVTPDSVAIGDVNGDGHLDLAVADFSAPGVAV